MIAYLVKFILCSGLLLVIYRQLLQSKAMYAFNRFYLLLSIIFSLSVPLIGIESNVPAIRPAKPVHTYLKAQLPSVLMPADTVVPQADPAKAPGYYIVLAWLAYATITGLLLISFLRKLYQINLTIKQNIQQEYEGSRLILLPEKMIPHTFLNCIFLNQDEYEANRIEKNILRHELTHARQWHSADVIFIELLRVFFWFNPLIILYRKAIQLNHEFIADSAVLFTEDDICGYQQLLINRLGLTKSLSITSQFNYSLTKKRLIMMTRTTSPRTLRLTRFAIFLLIPFLFAVFCNFSNPKPDQKSLITVNKAGKNKTLNKPGTIPEKQTAEQLPLVRRAIGDFPYSASPASQQLLDEYLAIVSKYENPDHSYTKAAVTVTDKNKMEQLFKRMNREQQAQQRIIFGTASMKPLPRLSPSTEEFEAWKDAGTYGVWINHKYVKNTELRNYQASDFSYYSKSRLYYTDQMKKDVMKRFNLAVMYKYQLGIMTNAYFKKYNDELRANQDKSVMMYAMIGQADKDHAVPQQVLTLLSTR